MDILAINAFLHNLTEGWDPEAAKAVIRAFNHLPLRQSHVETHQQTRNNSTLTGHTDEQGDVTVPDDQEATRSTGVDERLRARVGDFKVYRVGRPGDSIAFIMFQRFWAADLLTQGLGAPGAVYGIEYLTRTLEPHALVHFEPHETNAWKMLDWRQRLRIFWVVFKYRLQGRKVAANVWGFEMRPRLIWGYSTLANIVSPWGVNIDFREY